ncbi:MAG: class I SAM-dependent methyltransferase [Burkholderiales bacterium]
MKRRQLLLAALALAGCSTPGVKLDAPYVSTPYEVVAEMLQLAAVGPGDLVYDLGCGDGRIVIAAAKEFGARGVGVDIDPRRIAEANAAARRAGVAQHVRFVVQDLFQTDLSDATVVALYLFPEINEKLKPKFLAELKPGARIVSHEFGIGDWPPARTALVDLGGAHKYVHLWIVPPR